MNDSNRKLFSMIFGSGFIILIIISFMFTGEFSGTRPTSDTVATVGDQIVNVRDYNNEYKRQMNFYQQFMGGKPLTRQQIEQFGLKKNALKNLIQRAMLLEFGKTVGLSVSKDEIVTEVKGQAFFQTNNKFDLNKYKGLLRANGYTPEQWEDQTRKDLLRRKVNKVFDTYTISNTLAEELKKYKDLKKTVSLAKIDRNSLRGSLPISVDELKKYLADAKNKEQVQKAFNQRKASLSQQEEVKAHHILLKMEGKKEEEVKEQIEKIHKELTPSNFIAKANKYTEDGNMDPKTKKKNGGSLGWFGRGKMVPVFEKTAFGMKKNEISKPIKSQFGYHIIWLRDRKAAVEAKLADHENKIAKEQIRNSKVKELDDFFIKVSKEVEEAFKKGISQAEKVSKKYKLTFQKQMSVNRLEGIKGQINLDSTMTRDVFKSNPGDVKLFTGPTQNIVALIEKPMALKGDDKKVAAAEEKLDLVRGRVNRLLSKKLRENVLDSLQKQLSIYQNDDLL